MKKIILSLLTFFLLVTKLNAMETKIDINNIYSENSNNENHERIKEFIVIILLDYLDYDIIELLGEKVEEFFDFVTNKSTN